MDRRAGVAELELHDIRRPGQSGTRNRCVIVCRQRTYLRGYGRFRFRRGIRMRSARKRCRRTGVVVSSASVAGFVAGRNEQAQSPQQSARPSRRNAPTLQAKGQGVAERQVEHGNNQRTDNHNAPFHIHALSNQELERRDHATVAYRQHGGKPGGFPLGNCCGLGGTTSASSGRTDCADSKIVAGRAIRTRRQSPRTTAGVPRQRTSVVSAKLGVLFGTRAGFFQTTEPQRTPRRQSGVDGPNVSPCEGDARPFGRLPLFSACSVTPWLTVRDRPCKIWRRGARKAFKPHLCETLH